MKSLKAPIMFVLALLAAFVTASTAQASPTPDLPKDRQVLEAVSLIYAPMPDNRSGWLDAVCENMTEGGCGYFSDNLESMLWQSGQDIALNSVVPVPFGVVATLEDGSQVWKEEVSIYKTCGSALKDCPFIESDVYLHVVYDEAQDEWLLNRILYGPYIEE